MSRVIAALLKNVIHLIQNITDLLINENLNDDVKPKGEQNCTENYPDSRFKILPRVETLTISLKKKRLLIRTREFVNNEIFIT